MDYIFFLCSQLFVRLFAIIREAVTGVKNVDDGFCLFIAVLKPAEAIARPKSVDIVFLFVCLQFLEKLLPERKPAALPEGEHVEEVDLVEYDAAAGARANGQRGEAYHEDDSDDERAGPGMRNVQCAHQ